MLDLKTFFTAFGILFIAEIGDKTQLAVITLSAKTGSPLAVFAGAVCALTVISLFAVLAGGLIGRFFPETNLHKIAGAAFIVIGILMFRG